MNNFDLNDIYKSSLVRELIEKHNIKSSEIENYKLDLYNLIEQVNNCEVCKSLSTCKNTHLGFTPTVSYTNNQFYFEAVKCPYNTIIKSTFESSIDYNEEYDVYTTIARDEFFDKTKEIILNNRKKGIYLSGEFGSGKTYLMQVFAKRLASNNEVELLSFPSLVREIKSSIETNSTNSIVRRLKEKDVLILDDFNYDAFNNTWFRDEIMYQIFEYRIKNNLLTCFTSNYDFNILKTRFKSSEEKIDNLRLLERIKMLSEEIYLNDKNFRD